MKKRPFIAGFWILLIVFLINFSSGVSLTYTYSFALAKQTGFHFTIGYWAWMFWFPLLTLTLAIVYFVRRKKGVWIKWARWHVGLFVVSFVAPMIAHALNMLQVNYILDGTIKISKD